MWQSLVTIGRATSEIRRRKKEKNMKTLAAKHGHNQTDIRFFKHAARMDASLDITQRSQSVDPWAVQASKDWRLSLLRTLL